MKKAVKYLTISIILLVQAIAANAQTDKEFWFCIPQLSSQHEKDVPKLVITAFENNATVHIDMPRQSAFIPITVNVPAGTSKIIMFSTKAEATTIYNYKGKTPPADAIYAGDFMKDNNQESNILESGLYGESCQIKDKGIHITSNELITAYLERGVINNDDIWALKGKNAFGKEFIVPSQNDFKNFPFGGNSQNSPNAWNSIDIVAIEDVTVTITLTDKGSDLISLWPHGTSNKGSFKLKRGQTLSLQAKSQDASKHLGGTIITANGYIAVQWKDDSLYLQQPSLTDEYTCYDVIGDQLVPTKLAGTEYIVMRGQIGESLPSGKKKAEFVYIMAVKDGTTNVSFSTDNNDNISPITLTKRGEIKHIRLNNKLVNVLDKKNYNALHISADNPIIVMHIAGFGCEVGSAILPTING